MNDYRYTCAKCGSDDMIGETVATFKLNPDGNPRQIHMDDGFDHCHCGHCGAIDDYNVTEID